MKKARQERFDGGVTHQVYDGVSRTFSVLVILREGPGGVEEAGGGKEIDARHIAFVYDGSASMRGSSSTVEDCNDDCS